MTAQNHPSNPHYSSSHFETERHFRLWSRIQSELDTTDLAHDTHHIMRVYHWACRLAPEAEANIELCGAAALLHDLINVPKESDQRQMASELSAASSPPWLESVGYSSSEMGVIIEAIRTCSWSKGVPPHSPEGLALQEADRLDAIGAIGIMRNIACAQAMRHRGNLGCFYNMTDPIGDSNRSLDDRSYAIDHFRIKLLKIADGLTLPSAQKEGQKRHQFMLQFLETLAHETAHFSHSDCLPD